MASTGRLRSEAAREHLLQMILETLGSWPDLHRQVFIQSHYEGRRVEAISASLGLSVHEVRRTLKACNQNLRASLQLFRENEGDCSKTDPSHSVLRPAV